jgi:tRNA threonylcarbamoyladenosine biosynthesis protein TsaE
MERRVVADGGEPERGRGAMLIGDGISSSETMTETLGRRLGEALVGPTVWSLSGELGTGKTVFARGLLRGLGIDGPVRSPTFTLAIPYRGRFPVVHIDLYRLESGAAVDGLGWDDWLDTGRVLLVEWGERADAILGGDRLEMLLEHDGGDRRRITLRARGAAAELRGEGLQQAWERAGVTI